MSRKSNEPPEVNKPNTEKESSFASYSQQQPATNAPQNPKLDGNSAAPPPTYSQATYASIPPSQPPPITSAVPPQYVAANGVYMAPPSQNIVVVQGPSAYYANPRPQRLPDGSTACVQCGSVYPLPAGATSFRCRQCGKFNNIRGDQCLIL